MTQNLPESPVITVFVVVFCFDVVKDIIIKHYIGNVSVLTGRNVLFKRNLELAFQWVFVKFIIELVDQFYYSSSGHVSSFVSLG